MLHRLSQMAINLKEYSCGVEMKIKYRGGNYSNITTLLYRNRTTHLWMAGGNPGHNSTEVIMKDPDRWLTFIALFIWGVLALCTIGAIVAVVGYVAAALIGADTGPWFYLGIICVTILLLDYLQR